MGPNGKRITQEALDGFSKRSADIKEKAEALGIKSAEGRRKRQNGLAMPKATPATGRNWPDGGARRPRGTATTVTKSIAQPSSTRQPETRGAKAS